MSTWLTIPSARNEAESTVAEWKAAGYSIALYRDEGAPSVTCADLVLTGPYPGYAVAVNTLIREVMERDPEAEWFVLGGDDTLPDPNHSPEEIARECNQHFVGTFGVLQPTGDRFAGGSIDRIAGSPWMGREFCERAYGGEGPLYPGYEHMFVDEEILNVASKLGVYWPCRDFIHLHKHFMRASDDINSPAVSRQPPPHLVEWNSPEHWAKSKSLFENRRANGFPGHEPLPAEVMV